MGIVMRKLILIAAMSLLATQAFAGGSRSLSLASTNASQPVAEQPAATAAPQAPALPPASARTAVTAPTTTPPVASTQSAPGPAATPARPAAAPAAETARPKQRQLSTEARVIRELHRHGIYW